MNKFFLILFSLFSLCSYVFSQVDIYDSGGPLHPLMGIYDVQHYAIDIEFFPESKSIQGKVTMTAKLTESSDQIAFNLDTLLFISSIKVLADVQKINIQYQRDVGLVIITANQQIPKGTILQVTTSYSGIPLAAPIKKLSWSDGIFWDKTANGDHWITNITVLNGADIWWPCKDHPSDEPDSVDLLFTVPEPLIVASNGKLRGVENLGNKNKYHWHVSTPINNYNIVINAAPYQVIDTTIASISGDPLPIYFYVLPENYKKGQKLFKQIVEHLQFFEKTLGPYPFRADKYGVAETSYYGMENQSIIAYGNNYTNNDYGFDGLHFHELAHEWFANMVTCKNWKDWWIHEGLASYMESLYVEYLHGKEAYHKYANGYFARMKNEKPVSPTGHPTCKQQYISDVYSKGAAIIHNARYLVGDEIFLKSLRRLAYPDKAMENVTNGSHCRLSSTEEYISIFEEEAGKELDWYFLTVLRHADLPKLQIAQKGKKLKLKWITDTTFKYEMPVEIQIGDKIAKVNMKKGKGRIPITSSEDYQIDPNNWLLKEVETSIK